MTDQKKWHDCVESISKRAQAHGLTYLEDAGHNLADSTIQIQRSGQTED